MPCDWATSARRASGRSAGRRAGRSLRARDGVSALPGARGAREGAHELEERLMAGTQGAELQLVRESGDKVDGDEAN